MVATTRLRTLLQKSAPVQLAKISSSKTKSRRRLCAFVSKTSNKGVYKKAYRGVTKRLDLKLFSKGSLPRAKLHTIQGQRGWEGKNSGRRRGTAIDNQLSSIANNTSTRFKWASIITNGGKRSSGLYRPTFIALQALKAHGLRPVCAQRGVCSNAHNVATAIDMLCWKSSTNEL